VAPGARRRSRAGKVSKDVIENSFGTSRWDAKVEASSKYEAEKSSA
jgi:hypothetical protein